jgi:hypothetical protein
MMKTVVALTLVATLLAPTVVFAGASTDAALALGAFAVFNQILAGQTIFQGLGMGPVAVHQPAVAVYPPPPPPTVYYAPPPVVYHVPPPPPVVVYPHGTWELRRGYWVWMPKHHPWGHWKHHSKHGHDD